MDRTECIQTLLEEMRQRGFDALFERDDLEEMECWDCAREMLKKLLAEDAR